MPAATLAPVAAKPVPPLATADDLPWCTCTVRLDGTRPHYLSCELRNGADR